MSIESYNLKSKLPKNINSKFVSPQIRETTTQENVYLGNLKEIKNGDVDIETIGRAPAVLSRDSKARPIVLSKTILGKIESVHGNINEPNLIINTNDWDMALKNVDKNPDKINLVKKIPNSENYLVTSAVRNNGFFMITHFETIVTMGNELKSLLGRGDLISKDARPESLVAPFKTRGQPEGVSGVKGVDIKIVPKNKK